MLMGMEPAGRRPLRWGKGHRAGASGGNHALGTAVHGAGNLQTVPVHGGLFRQTVMNIDGRLLTLLKL